MSQPAVSPTAAHLSLLPPPAASRRLAPPLATSPAHAWTVRGWRVRCRSLAKSVLGNLLQHAGLLHQLTTLRAAPGVLQKVNPKSLLATSAR